MDNQRLLLYFALALVLYLIWQAWQRDYGPAPVPVAQAPVTDAAQAPKSIPKDLPEASDVPQVEEPRATVATTDQRPSRERIRVITDVLDVEIGTRGGDILRADLLAYPVSIKTPDNPFRLLDDQIRVYIAQSGLIHDRRHDGEDVTTLAPSHHAKFSVEKSEFRLRDGEEKLEVPMVWRGPNGVAVTKIFTFRRGSYLVDVDQVVENQGQNTWTGSQYRQLRHSPIRDEDTSHFLYTFTGGAYYDNKYEKVSFEDMAEEPLRKEMRGGWTAMLQHYFVSAWAPHADETNLVYTKSVNGNYGPESIIGLRSLSMSAAPGEAVTFNTRLFMGPKLQHQLEEIAEGLELVTDYGIFAVISQPLFWLLEFIYSWIGNWGWSIIVLTILIKLVFYKLSETSYRSMARMRNVQPRLVAIKERHSGDKQKMNQALMELYKKEKINPLGGCLPILVQIPVFIALYWTLLESVELRQAPFVLWINDLATPDPFYVLPILMGVTMVVQQKLNPAPLDPLQAKLMMALPIVFTGFFAFFPAGLVLYWFVNNLLSIAQQWVITKRIEKAAN